MPEQQSRLNSGPEIIARLKDGKLDQEQAVILMQRLTPVKAQILGHTKDENFIDRMEVSERISHAIGYLAYAFVGVAHGVLDATAYTASELAEITTFAVSRVIYRAGDGWNRGRSRLNKGGRP